MRFFRKKRVPVAWVVDGDKEISIGWDDGRILKVINRALKYIEKMEKQRRKLEEEIIKACGGRIIF